MTRKAFNIFAVMTAILMVVVFNGFAADRQVYEISPQSQIILNGASNVNSFTFHSQAISGHGEIDTTARNIDTTATTSKDAIDVSFRVDVRTFDSGNSRMNRDMYKALKAEENPYIEFQLLSLKFERFLGEAQALFSAQGSLEVAGVENKITLSIMLSQVDNQLYQLQGHKRIKMTHYEIEPPKALFGLVQARDELTVQFDIYAAQQFNNTLAANDVWDGGHASAASNHVRTPSQRID